MIGEIVDKFRIPRKLKKKIKKGVVENTSINNFKGLVLICRLNTLPGIDKRYTVKKFNTAIRKKL